MRKRAVNKKMDITMTALMTSVINLAMLCMVVWLFKQTLIVVRYVVKTAVKEMVQEEKESE